MSDTLTESLPAHAPLGPSSAEGWTVCADYVNANRGLPDITIEAAAEGTAAHAISDLCLTLGLDAEDLTGLWTSVAGYRFEWDDEDAMLLQTGLGRLRAAVGDATFYSERRVDISPWTLPGQFGTLDRAWVAEVEGEWWVCIEDLKWGRGIAVSPVENKQVRLYALGFWHDVARHVVPAGAKPRFRLSIDQPRHAGGGGVWITSLDDLLSFGEWVRERAALTDTQDAERTASLKGCMWCRRRRVATGCDTYDRYMIDLLGLDWDAIDLGILMTAEPDLPRELTPERRSWLLLHKDSIRRWLDQLDEEAMADAQAGRETGLIKAVEGNKLPDKFVDKKEAERVVEEVLGERGFVRRLRTPKQIEAEVAGDDPGAIATIAGLIERGHRKPVLVPMEDARPPIRGGAEFEDLNERNTA